MSLLRLIKATSWGLLGFLVAGCAGEEEARVETKRASLHAAQISKLLSQRITPPRVTARFPSLRFIPPWEAEDQQVLGFTTAGEPARVQSLLEYDYEAGMRAMDDRLARRMEVERMLAMPPLAATPAELPDLNSLRSQADLLRQTNLVNLRMALGFQNGQLAEIRRSISASERLRGDDSRLALLRENENSVVRKIAEIQQQLAILEEEERLWMLSKLPSVSDARPVDFFPGDRKSPLQRKEDLQIDSFYKSWELLSQPRALPFQAPPSRLKQNITRTIARVRQSGRS